MEKDKKPRGRSIFNLFDIIVIIVAVVLAAVLFFAKNGGTEQTSAQTSTLHYTIELTGMLNNSAEMIAPGDALVDKVKKYDIGTVQSVEVSNTVKQAEDTINGAVVMSEVPGQQTAVIVVEAQVSETATLITVDGGFEIKVGNSVSVKGPGYWGSGYIIAVERGDE
ncbi:MAG: DUF4330 domain-containing protein [Oscillospiraceae bacterium]